MQVIPMHQAKTTLSHLVKRAVDGETILIGPHGEPMVQLVPVADAAARAPKRRLGGLKGRMRVSRGFDAPVPGLEDAFEGRDR